MSVVITHPEMGIYIGNAMGLGFWSKWDGVGQTQAAVFPSEVEAKAHVASWDERNVVEDYEYATVETEDPDYATVEELRAAGLEDLLGELQITHQGFGTA